MASSKPSKRPYPDSDSDSEPLPSTFPHFIVFESLDEKQLTKLNPIIIEKTISGIVNPISVKKLNNGTLLIEVDKKAYAENLLKMKTFAGLKIKASPHLSLNSSKGVVRSSELSLCDCSLYVDDFLICYRSKHIHTIERQLQQCLNKIQKWALENGFKFSKTKTQCMHFCLLRGLHNDPVLRLDGVEIPVVAQYKFLGVIFDRKLSFIPHINYLKAKCQKALQLLRVVAHTDWGADKSTLLKLYRSLVRSKLDYGCFIYGSARKSYLRCLDSIHHLGLRLALGALRTSPVESLYVEANEAPLSLRRERLALQYYTKLQSCPSNPAFECTIDPKYKELFARKESAIPSFGIRIQSLLDASGILTDNVHATVIPQVPPWTMHHPKVCLDLSILAKKDTPSHVFIQKFNEIKDQYSYCTPIYTDGSKDNDRVGCGLIINNLSIKQRLPSNASIFTAEVTAIDLALDTIAESDDDHFIIFSDSLSVLLSLHDKKMDNPLILQLLQKLHHFSCAHKTIHLCWIPSHIGFWWKRSCWYGC